MLGRDDAGMHPDMAMQAAYPETVMRTAECDREAALLRGYCEGKFPFGGKSYGPLSVTGEKHTELCSLPHSAYPTPAKAREAAQERFDQFAQGAAGLIYWRVFPEIAYSTRKQGFAYYLRMLISDKPRNA